MWVYDHWHCLPSRFPSDRREAVLLPSLQQGFCRQVQSQGSPTDPFGCEKIPMQELLQNFLQDVSSAQAWGIWLLCSALNWDHFSTSRKQKLSVASLFFRAKEDCQRNHTDAVFCSQICSLFLFSTTGPFHFRVRNSSALTCFSFQAVFLWLQSVLSFCQSMSLPTCAIHALFCMSRLFYTPSQCYLQCLYQCPSMAVVQSSTFLFYQPHTSNSKRRIMNDSINITRGNLSHCYLGNKCKLSFLWRNYNFCTVITNSLPALEQQNKFSQVPQFYLIHVFINRCLLYVYILNVSVTEMIVY